MADRNRLLSDQSVKGSWVRIPLSPPVFICYVSAQGPIYGNFFSKLMCICSYPSPVKERDSFSLLIYLRYSILSV